MPRIKPTTIFTARTPPSDSIYNRPRYIEATALCDIFQDLLHDITGVQLGTSDNNSEPIPIITTIYT